MFKTCTLKEFYPNEEKVSEYKQMLAIEGIISKCGRVIGKMGHSERQGDNRFKNIYGPMDQKLFESGVSYFKK